MPKRKTGSTSGVTTNAGLTTDGVMVALKLVDGVYKVTLPAELAGKTATLDKATGRWVLS